MCAKHNSSPFPIPTLGYCSNTPDTSLSSGMLFLPYALLQMYSLTIPSILVLKSHLHNEHSPEHCNSTSSLHQAFYYPFPVLFFSTAFTVS